MVTVEWGKEVLVLRFSIVEQDVPFLVSKYVMKRIGGVLDLDENLLTLKRLGGAKEQIYDLITGHVGLELAKEGGKPPMASQETLDHCLDGEEVAVENVVSEKL